jgi:DNA-3-methyladenine glycosylase II
MSDPCGMLYEPRREKQMITTRRRLEVLGPFDLARAAAFSFGPKEASGFDGVYRMAFVLDGYASSAGVVVRQPEADWLELDICCAGEAEADVAAVQTARILSVDVDARGSPRSRNTMMCSALWRRPLPACDPRCSRARTKALGWAVLSARRPRAQMMTLRERLSDVAGEHFALDGGPGVTAFPTPQALLAVTSLPGLPEEKLRRLHGVARAAMDGRLDTERLRRLSMAEAADTARTLDGVGPFYAELMVVRALGHTDALPHNEPRLLARLGSLLARPAPIDGSELELLAERWRPWRTWACVHIRAVVPPVEAAVGPRVATASA